MEDEPEIESPRVRVPTADLLIAFALVLTTLAAYARVIRFGFLSLDDGPYVFGNAHLRGGLTARSLKWIFLSFYPDNWFPLTRFSLFVDYNLFGLRAGLYHAENLIIHCLAALLLFGFLRQSTRVRWPCAFVAFMFALHPLHVESVAWIAERKDVLCAFFWFAALWAWLRYTERPEPGRYIFALVLFGLGLMSKPMIVTLPFLLFLLDVWPLRRPFSRKLITEKIPLIALSCAVMALTVAAQRGANAIQPLSAVPLVLRVENALITVAIYIADTFWPARLWLPHVFPRSLPVGEAIAAAAGIAVISAVVVRQWRSRPYLAVGWFWFLGTLVPVIGLLQVGQQARSDRYMYIPMVGLSIMLAWGAAGAVRLWPRLRVWAAMLGTAACLAMAVKTSAQTKYWKDPEVLFRHAIDGDSRDELAWNYLGEAIVETHPERALEAVLCYRTALRIRPEMDWLHNNLANALCKAGRLEDGIAEYREAIGINPALAETHFRLAEALKKTGRGNEAVDEFQTALRLDPQFAAAHNDLGVLLCKLPGRSAEGLLHLERAVEIDPENAEAQSNLGLLLVDTPSRAADAIPHLREALRLDPMLAGAHLGLAAVFMKVPGAETEEEAVGHLQAAQRLK
jgi:tetratricopeptide (TPR) repeat protein